MSRWGKTSANVLTVSRLGFRPTTPSSGSAHNLQFPLRQTFPPPNPARLPVERPPKQSSPSPFCLRTRPHLSHQRHPLAPPPHSRPRCPPLVPQARPRNSQEAARLDGSHNIVQAIRHISDLFRWHLHPACQWA